ncbi:MAG: tRNA (N(6)-L-threonylcarbamoyladenosine(37)-C(2))-methylthiotransferase MtaB [Marinilabiliaceae bacterium]|jgi:threonylcarbamoyladenosine tRNA methylthiotransferase MtaB|nr:tRNA (N(6)-L-threonylcarbamoyladenosine(37)-C(2))-methylthiotransferase MtaB [Marinilabiliaceae bacterium]
MTQTRKKVAFHTLGCKLNFSETSTLARSLNPDLYERVDFSSLADIYVINTCSVTEAADRKCRQAITKTIRKAPGSYIIVVGCYAQLKPGEISAIKGVDLVLGVNERFNLHKYIDRIEKEAPEFSYTCTDHDQSRFESSFSLGDRTRSFMKVQDGCDYMCSYCTIPLARGKSRNQSIEKCVLDAKKIAANNIKEIVITGVNIGDFGKSTGENFYTLLKELVKVEGIDRYRISSIEPNLLTDDIIKLVNDEPALLPHFHIPLQSGNNRILGLMRRRYQREVFEERVQKIKELMPFAAVGADLIVGFPGESEEEFNDTSNFISKLPLSYLHVFSFSPRKDTPAALLPGPVGAAEKHRRSKLLQRLSENRKLGFYRENTGKSYKVLWENIPENGFVSGFTENYIRVFKRSSEEITGTIEEVTLGRMNAYGDFII